MYSNLDNLIFVNMTPSFVYFYFLINLEFGLLQVFNMEKTKQKQNKTKKQPSLTVQYSLQKI